MKKKEFPFILNLNLEFSILDDAIKMLHTVRPIVWTELAAWRGKA